MMTREEAILLSAYTGFLLAPDFSEVHKFCEDTLGRPIWTHEFADRCVQKEIQAKLRPQIMELVQNISALRPITREQVEKMKKNAVSGQFEDWYGQEFTCPECGHKSLGKGNFCKNCGCPHTDEAVQMVLERLEALHGETETD